MKPKKVNVKFKNKTDQKYIVVTNDSDTDIIQNQPKTNNIFSINELNEIVDEYVKPDPFTKYVNYETKISNMQEKINIHQNSIWCPGLNVKYNNISKIKSWFPIVESNPQKVQFVDGKYNIDDQKDVKYKAKKIILHLTKRQKLILNIWLNAYLDMYNISLKYIKNNIKTDQRATNYYYLRSKLLNEKQELLKRFDNIVTKKSKKINVKVHDIDFAIKLACANWKSAITNLRNGNIKHFRIRYWKREKPIKIMDLEKKDFESGSIRKQILGQVKGEYDGMIFNFDTINCDCRLKRENNEYFLYVPEQLDLDNLRNKNKEIEKNKQISIDLGVRVFASCITENKIVKIGEDSKKRIEEYLIKKDKILNNEYIKKDIKKKNELMINRKIKNLVNELHWKTINYLILNYENILIGDLSAKSIVSKDGVLNAMTKRIAMCLSFYEFRQRLKYKCDVYEINYGLINEWMTSKMCSRCGEIDYNLKGKKIYKCKECNLKIDRDINGARNIHIKARK